MLKNKIDTKKIENKIKTKTKKILWFLGDRAFLAFIILFLIATFLNVLIFYIYEIRPSIEEPKVEIKTVKLNENFYQAFLKNYKQRQKNFNEIENKTYIDPFFSPSQSE